MLSRTSLLAVVPAALVLALASTTTATHTAAPAAAAVVDVGSRATTYAHLPTRSVVADGPVDQVVHSGHRVYALGGFAHVGTYTGPGRVVDVVTGADLPAPVLPDGQVSVVVGDGNGGWYVGGDFDMGDYPDGRGGLQHVLADGTEDPAFDVGTNGLVSALAYDDGTLWVGGQFDRVGTAVRHNLAAVRVSDGAVRSFRADQDQRVTELLLGNDHLYVGSDHVEAVDPVTGAAVEGFEPTATGPSIGALALGGGLLYVGGPDVIAVDPDTGAPDDAFHVTISGQHTSVHTLAYVGSRLYVGSDAPKVAGRTGYLAAVVPGTGALDTSFDPRVSGGRASYSSTGGVFDLSVQGEKIWVAGAFSSAGGKARHDLAVLDTQTGAALSSPKVPGFTNQVNAITPGGTGLYVGGHFFLDEPAGTTRLAAFDDKTLQPVAGFHARAVSQWGGELVAAPNALYVGKAHFYGYDPIATQPPYYTDDTEVIRAYGRDTGAADPRRTHRVRNLTGFTTVGSRLVVAQRLRGDVKFPGNRITVYGPDGRVEHTYRMPLRGYISYLTSVQGDLLAVGSFKASPAHKRPWDSVMVRFGLRDGALRLGFDPHLDGAVYHAAVSGGSIYATGLFSDWYPDILKMDARSKHVAAFDPAPFDHNGVLLRTTALGDLLWVGGSQRHYLNARTGAVVADPTHGRAHETTSVTRVPGGLVWGSTTYGITMEGSSWNVLGYVARVAR